MNLETYIRAYNKLWDFGYYERANNILNNILNGVGEIIVDDILCPEYSYIKSIYFKPFHNNSNFRNFIVDRIFDERGYETYLSFGGVVSFEDILSPGDDKYFAIPLWIRGMNKLIEERRMNNVVFDFGKEYFNFTIGL